MCSARDTGLVFAEADRATTRGQNVTKKGREIIRPSTGDGSCERGRTRASDCLSRPSQLDSTARDISKLEIKESLTPT